MIIVLAFVLLVIGVPVAWEVKQSPESNTFTETASELNEVFVKPVKTRLDEFNGWSFLIRELSEFPALAKFLHFVEKLVKFFRGSD